MASNLLVEILGVLVHQLPAVLMCLAACIVLLSKWESNSASFRWALVGFGILLLIGFAVPVTQVYLQHWLRESGNAGNARLVYGISGGVWSVLRAAAYGFLLAAVLSTRRG